MKVQTKDAESVRVDAPIRLHVYVDNRKVGYIENLDFYHLPDDHYGATFLSKDEFENWAKRRYAPVNEITYAI